MEVKWTRAALADLTRLHDFLAGVNPSAAARVVQSLTRAPGRLLSTPRLGEPLPQFAPREVRRLLVGQYELRYELTATTLYVLRLWHTREQRT